MRQCAGKVFFCKKYFSIKLDKTNRDNTDSALERPKHLVYEW